MNRRHWAALALAGAALAVLVGFALSRRGDHILNEVQRRGALYVGIEGDNPPFSLIEGDTVVGLDADLARALAEALGVEVHFVVGGYDGLYDALDVGKVDVLISALWVDPNRLENFRYTVPYFDAGQMLVVHAGSANAPEGAGDLEGRTVAVEFGSAGDVWARGQKRRLHTLHIRRCDTPAEALDALTLGEVDAAIIDSVSLRLDGRSGLIAAEAVTYEPYAAVTRAESGQLWDALNAALRAMMADGRLDALIARWF